MAYKVHDVFISSSQKKKLESAVKSKRRRTVKVRIQTSGEKIELLLTQQQILKVDNARKRNKGTTITMSKRQMHANMTSKGGFLSALAGLAARTLSSMLGGLAASILSGAVGKASKS